MRKLSGLATLTLCLLVACGDDGDDLVTDGGVSDGSVSGRGGSGGRAGSGGRGGSGGRAGAGESGSGGDGADSTQHVTIKFKAKVGSSDFACGTRVPNQGAMPTTVEPSDFRAYVQDVALIDESGDEVELTLETREPWQTPEVALLDFEDGTGQCAEGDSGLNAEITGTVPRGHYTGIAFTNGVPQELNHGDPAVLPPPLRGGALSWGWLIGYRFIKLELVAESEPDAAVAGGLLHVGSTGCSNAAQDDGGVDFGAPPAIECMKQNRNRIRLDGYTVGTSVIVADASKVFSQADLSVDSSCHSGGDCQAMFASVGLDFNAGTPVASQSLYRLE